MRSDYENVRMAQNAINIIYSECLNNFAFACKCKVKFS